MASATDSSLVLVTGASGYIATHIIKQLQEAGYRVRGSVRSLQDEAKIKHLTELCPDAPFKLELVEADLTKPESWESAVKDASYVIHVASPYPSQVPKDENEVIQPAVDGTQSILKACVESKSIKRCVLTSSVSAIAGEDETKPFTEEDWANPEKLDAHAKSKTLAEKAAWDYIKELPDDDKIELTVINPSFVMGPVLHGTQCTSMEVVKRLMERSVSFVPKLSFSVVDVRDVAAAHIKAMTLPEAAGQRYIVCNQNMWMKEIAQVLAKEFKPKGYSVPTLHCPYFALWCNSLIDKSVKTILPHVGKEKKYDNTKLKEQLGIVPRESKDTIIDMANTMIAGGFIVKKAKKERAPKKEGEEGEAKEGEKAEGDENADDKPKENGDTIEEKQEEEKKDATEEKDAKTADESKAEEKKEDTQEAEKSEDKPAESADK